MHMHMDGRPCEYCGEPLPAGVDRRTRQYRGDHFQTCEAAIVHRAGRRLAAVVSTHQLQVARLAEAGFTRQQAYLLLEMFTPR